MGWAQDSLQTFDIVRCDTAYLLSTTFARIYVFSLVIEEYEGYAFLMSNSRSLCATGVDGRRNFFRHFLKLYF
jgi:hypothetical protein